MNNPSKLILRKDVFIEPLSWEHGPNMFRWMCDLTVSRNLGLRQKPSLERTQAWIANALQNSTMHAYAVMHRGHHVGNVILDRIDDYLENARLSVYIGEPSARQLGGIGTTGIYLVLYEAFFCLKLHKIWLTVHIQNFPAINLYRKLGFHLEGVLREEFWLDGQRIDLMYMGLLKEEFVQLSALKKPEEESNLQIDDSQHGIYTEAN